MFPIKEWFIPLPTVPDNMGAQKMSGELKRNILNCSEIIPEASTMPYKFVSSSM
jgi:hypothetical protein